MIKRITKIIEKEVLVTTDGKEFDTEHEEEAQIHQDVIDGVKKLCGECNGTKFYSVDEGDWGYFEKWVQKSCKHCNGKGYLELKWS